MKIRNTRTDGIAMIIGMAGLAMPILFSGCKKPEESKTTSTSSRPDSVGGITVAIPTSSGSTSTTQSQVQNQSEEIRKSSSEFVRALMAGNANGDLLTPEYRATIAEPLFESEKAMGYSSQKLAIWMQEFAKRIEAQQVDCLWSNQRYGYAVATGVNGKLWLRMIKSDNLWLVDRIAYAALTPGQALTFPATETDAVAWFSAVGFISMIQEKSYTSAMNCLSKKGKASIAEPKLPSDMVDGYNDQKLKDVIQNLIPARTYVNSVKVTGNTVVTELATPGGVRTLTVELSNGTRPWEMLIDRMELR